MFKIITMKNVHIITHWNLLYALKIWNCLNFIQRKVQTREIQWATFV